MDSGDVYVGSKETSEGPQQYTCHPQHTATAANDTHSHWFELQSGVGQHAGLLLVLSLLHLRLVGLRPCCTAHLAIYLCPPGLVKRGDACHMTLALL
jgi:hypothetical protein